MKVLLNLLPEEGRSAIRTQFYFRFFFWQAVGILCLLCFFVLMLGVTYFLVGENKKVVETLAAKDVSIQDNLARLNKYEATFKEANAIARQSTQLSEGHLYWTGFLVRFGKLVPESVKLDHLSTKDYTVYLSGTALKRDDLLVLQKRIESDGCFHNVNIPVSDLFTRENVAFQMEFDVDMSCLKLPTKS